MRGRSAREWLREVVLSGAAVVGSLCLLAAIGSVAFGLRPLIFRSGSMEPAIGTGALALARTVPADTVRRGDVVSVVAASGTRITHRVVSTSPGPVTTLILKGDANELPDAQAYPVSEVALVVAQVDRLGYVVSWLQHPASLFLGGVLVGILIMIAFTTRGPPPDRGDRPGGPADDEVRSGDTEPSVAQPRRALLSTAGRPSWRRAATGLVAMTTVMIMTGTATGTRAAFQDTAAATTGAFAAQAQPAAPILSCTALGVLAIRFSWTAVTDATGYDLVLTTNGGGSTTYSTAAAVVTTTVNGVASTGTAVVRAKITYPSTTWYSTASNTRSYTFAAVSLCS